MKVDVSKIFTKDGNKSAEMVASLAIKNSTVLKQVLEAASSENKRIKNASAKCLREISRINPQKLYKEFNFFVKLIEGQDTILKWNAIEILSNLTDVDTDNKFKSKVLTKYFAFLKDESMVTAANTIVALGKVAANKSGLRQKITAELIKSDSLPYSAECQNILAGHAFLAFEKYAKEMKNKNEIISFAKKHFKNKRSSTRKKAEKLLKTLSN